MDNFEYKLSFKDSDSYSAEIMSAKARQALEQAADIFIKEGGYSSIKSIVASWGNGEFRLDVVPAEMVAVNKKELLELIDTMPDYYHRSLQTLRKIVNEAKPV